GIGAAVSWRAGQNGVPESRIVRFLVGGSGYIFHLASSLRALLADNVSPLRLDYTNAEVTAFTSYDYPLGVAPQLTSDRVINSGAVSGGSPAGYFINGSFSEFETATSAPIGAFRHSYTLDGNPATVILKIESDGHIYD